MKYVVDAQKYELGYMGQFLRHYEPRVNLNSIINTIRTKPAVFRPMLDAVITREVQFPDVSFYQKDIDYNTMRQHTDSIIIRLGQNLWPDEKLERNYTEAKRVGLRVGFYWFYDDRISPGDQARLLISLLQNKQWEMEVFIDWENSYGGRYKGLQNVVAMMQAVEAGIPGIEVGLYTGYYFFRENSNAITNASQYNYLKVKRLWLAWYANDPSVVRIPAPWTKLHHWQWGTPVVSWGQMTSELDMNFFKGSVQEFEQLYGGTTGGGNTMLVIVGTALGNVKIRKSAAGDEFDPPRYLLAGDQIEADRNEAQWLHLTKINGVRVVGEQWSSAGSQEQYISWEWREVVDPDPEPSPTIVKVHQIDVFNDGKISVDGGPVI